MARIRTIKPEFPQSETTGKLSRDARLLFIQLWTLADDFGRARAASRMLASLLYPYDDDVPALIEGWLDELERENCIRRYEVDGSTYLDIPNWLKHQKIDHPSKTSNCPSFEESREPSRALAPDLGPRTMDLGPRTKNPVDAESTPTLPDVDLDEKPKRVPTQSADLIRTVGDRWNELAASLHLSQVAELHATRKSKILARAEDLVKIYEFPDPLTGFSDLFSRIRGSPFLRGESKPRNGEKPFRCHFEFAFEKSSFTSIMEGKYEDRSQGTAGR